MKLLLTILIISSINACAFAKKANDESLFKADKIQLLKVEMDGKFKNYFVKFPFDPMVGWNTAHIEAVISSQNHCQPFFMTSPTDKIKIKVTPINKKNGCEVSESIQNYGTKPPKYGK